MGKHKTAFSPPLPVGFSLLAAMPSSARHLIDPKWEPLVPCVDEIYDSCKDAETGVFDLRRFQREGEQIMRRYWNNETREER